MKTTYHRLHQFILGLAYVLEHVSKTIPDTSTHLKAYLFSFENRRRSEFLFMNLMNFVLQKSPPDPWLVRTASEYVREPLAERSLCWDLVVDSFLTDKKILEEESFHYSLLKPEYRRIAQEVYTEHQYGFDFLASKMFHARTALNPDSNFGILFVQYQD